MDTPGRDDRKWALMIKVKLFVCLYVFPVHIILISNSIDGNGIQVGVDFFSALLVL